MPNPGDDNGLITRTELRATLRELRADIEAEFQKLRAEVDTLREHQVQRHGGESCQDSGDLVEGSKADDKSAGVHRIAASPTRSLAFVERERVLRPKAQYVWSHTLWDASVFVGIETAGHGASALICYLLASAIIAQLVYIYIIEDILVQNPVSETAVAETWFWRYFIAHDIRYMEPHSGRSLATRVCTSDLSLEVSLKQQETYSAIESYQADKFVKGSSVCLLSISCFLTVVIVELRKCLGLLFSLGELVSPTMGSLIRMNQRETKKFVLQSISRRRYIAVLLMTAVRVAIAVLLGTVATRFLVHTTSVQTLFLMSMKFAFVMNIDDLFFAALIPGSVKDFISELAPISASYRLKRYAGIDLSSTTCLICLVAAFILAFVETWNFATQIETLKEAVCGGNTNFVFAMNPTNGIIEWAATSEDAGGLSDISRSYVVAAVRELKSMSINSQSTLSFHVDLERVSSLSTMSSGQEGTSTLPGCVDRLDADIHSHLAQLVLSSKIGYNVTSCQAISDYQCDAHTEVRALCPVACGCGDFNSGMFTNSISAGCASDCFNLTYGARLNACADMAVTELQVCPEWLRYWNGYEQHFRQPGMVELSLQSGCSIIHILKQEAGYDFCAPSADNVPGNVIPGRLTGFCPVTCGCHESFSLDPFCPDDC